MHIYIYIHRILFINNSLNTLKLFDYLGAVLYQYHNKVLKINVNQMNISETNCDCDSSIIYDNHFHIVVHSFKGNNQHYTYVYAENCEGIM